MEESLIAPCLSWTPGLGWWQEVGQTRMDVGLESPTTLVVHVTGALVDCVRLCRLRLVAQAEQASEPSEPVEFRLHWTH